MQKVTELSYVSNLLKEREPKPQQLEAVNQR
jgi:hypothetical protein